MHNLNLAELIRKIHPVIYSEGAVGEYELWLYQLIWALDGGRWAVPWQSRFIPEKESYPL